jgi:hypothetical protein
MNISGPERAAIIGAVLVVDVIEWNLKNINGDVRQVGGGTFRSFAKSDFFSRASAIGMPESNLNRLDSSNCWLGGYRGSIGGAEVGSAERRSELQLRRAGRLPERTLRLAEC